MKKEERKAPPFIWAVPQFISPDVSGVNYFLAGGHL
jgi:hypothetical protein